MENTTKTDNFLQAIQRYTEEQKSIANTEVELLKEEKLKKAEENGELVFSYGSPEAKISEVQSVTWTKDGMLYQLLQIDGKLSAGELSKMAEEILNQ